MVTRRSKILEAVVDAGQVTVSELSQALDVSQVTIRKDLDDLEGRGLIRRERGYAILVSPDDPASRIAYHYADKQRIARAAAATVTPGEMVMIEAGSCCTLLAEAIAGTVMGTTIVTNSAFIAERIRKEPHARTILLGGEYQNDSQVLVGPLTQLCAQQFYVDKLFIGTDGFSPEAGFTARDYLRASTVRNLATRARQTVVLTESDKFGRQAPVPLLPVQDVGTVWTDPAVPDDLRAYLKARGVAVRIVATDDTPSETTQQPSPTTI